MFVFYFILLYILQMGVSECGVGVGALAFIKVLNF